MDQALLITPAELPQYGASSDLLWQFRLAPVLVQVVTGGALGLMTWQWQRFGDASYSETFASETAGGSAWSSSLPDPAFATATFAPGTYNAGDVYTISSTGVVMGGTTGGVGLLTATRLDVVTQACTSATSRGVTWMQPRCVAPIISVGPGTKEWLTSVVIYSLRSREGMTPAGAGAGDDNVRARAVDAEKNLRAIGISQERPPDIVDSSSDGTGAGFTAMPISGCLVGWQ